MKIEKNDMVMVYDGDGTVPHCKYTGRFGDLTAYWQEIVSDAVYLFRQRYRRTVSVQLHPGWPVATTGSMPMTDSGWLHYRDLKSRCPVCKRPAHIAKRDGDFYFVDDEYNPFVRHAPVKTMGSSTTRKTVIRRSTVTWIR